MVDEFGAEVGLGGVFLDLARVVVVVGSVVAVWALRAIDHPLGTDGMTGDADREQREQEGGGETNYILIVRGSVACETQTYSIHGFRLHFLATGVSILNLTG